MKKILALLALAGFTSAFAQSSVQLFGNLDQALYRGTYGGNSMLTTASNAGTTSFWGIRGSEKLGAGNTASFELRSEVSMNGGLAGSSTTGISGSDSRSSSIFNRGAWVDLTNDSLGGVRVGRQLNSWWEMTTNYNNTGINSFGWGAALSVASGSNSQHLVYNGTDLSAAGKALNYMGAASSNPSQTGTSESFIGGITYTTPTVAGFTGKLQVGTLDTSYTTAQAANNTKGAALEYKQGDLQLGYGFDVKNDSNGDAALSQRALGANYTLGAYKLTAARNETTFGGLAASQGAHNLTTTGLGLGTSRGAWDYNLAWTKLVDQSDSANAARYLGAVARYNFSKTASWYVGAGQTKNTGLSRLGPVHGSSSATIPVSGDTGKTVNALLTGLRVQF